jgi:hypothetical protein
MSLVSKLDSLLVLMIETPHTLHTHRRSYFYIYKVFQHLLQWLQVIRMLSHPEMISALWLVGPDVVDVAGGSLLVLMIEAPHSFHIHSRSTLYIYNVFQHLQLWLVIIWM